MLETKKGPIRWQDFQRVGVEDHALHEMVREGTLIYPVKGVFALPGDYNPLLFALTVLRVHGTEFFSCLLTAAQFHGLLPERGEYLWLVLPSNRETLREVCGFEPIPVRWNAMRLPTERPMLSDFEKSSIGWSPDMSPLEETERYYGVHREWGYGVEIKVTTPGRTICDLLAFKGVPLGREGLKGTSIEPTDAYDAVKAYCERYDLAEAKEMAIRMSYPDEVLSALDMAERLQQTSQGPK